MSGLEKVESFCISIGGEEIDFRAVTVSEEAYQALSIAVQLKFAEYEQQNQEEIDALKSSYDAEVQQERIKYDGLYEEFNQIKIERHDLQSKWEAAANERNDLATENEVIKAEIESYKSQITELRNQVTKEKVSTNQNTGSYAEAMEKLKASRPAIYNVVEINGTKSTAISVETNETIEVHPNYIGKYRIVSHDEAMQIRAAMEAEKDNVPDIAEPVEVEEPTIEAPTFREPEVSDAQPINIVVGDTELPEIISDVAGGVVTESFEQEIRRRITDLESTVYGAGWADKVA
jgi:hypothetical protein